MTPSADLRACRLEAGLSQEQLAASSGVSRQAIGAIEACRHRPGVDAALALAAALGVSVEALFARPPDASSPILGGDVADGCAVLASRVGKLRVHARADAADALERWPISDGVMRDGVVEEWAGAGDGLVIVGCDPALGLLSALLPQAGPRRLLALHGSTRTAIQALDTGRAHAALVHGRAESLPTPPADTVRVRLARWRVGLASTEGARARSLTALVGGRAVVVQREDGASSQQALLRALDDAGAPHPDGPIASGHLSAVRGVLGGARAAVTMEPAAVDAHLSFLALEEHEVEIWVRSEHGAHPGFDALTVTMRSRAFQDRLAAVGGYDLASCGSLI